MRIKSAAAALLALAGCSESAGEKGPAVNAAAAPEPMPPAEELAADAELANRAAEAEAADAEIGSDNSGTDANFQ